MEDGKVVIDGLNLILGKVETLATKIGVASDHILELYTRQAFIEGISGLVVVFILILTCIGLFIGADKMADIQDGRDTNTSTESTESTFDLSAFLYLLGWFVAMITFLNICIGLCDTVGKLFNPELFGFKAFLGDISKL